MNERSDRRSQRSALCAVAAVALVSSAMACGKAASPSSSSSSHWLLCEVDADCASRGPSASCGESGVCVDSSGVPIQAPVEDSTRGDEPDAEPSQGGTGPCGAAGCTECPAPRVDPNVVCIAATAAWARDPASGLCCRYEDRECGSPVGWFQFESEEECQTSCRCAEVDYVDPPTNFRSERLSLECQCQDGDCPANLDAELTRICANPLSVPWVRSEGCGMIQITLEGGFSGGSTVYDAATGALVGVSSFSDIATGPCSAHASIAGRPFECDAVTRCELCGTRYDPSIPPCE